VSKIAFLIDLEKGHVYPTFDLARSLSDRGHEVTYLGIPEMAKPVRSQGFSFVPVFEELYPLGLAEDLYDRMGERLRQAAAPADEERAVWAQPPHLESMLSMSDLDRALERLRPDLLICSFFLPVEILILWYRWKIPFLIVTTSLRLPEETPDRKALATLFDLGPRGAEVFELARKQGLHVRTLEEFVRPLAEVPELIFCPPEFDFEGQDRGPHAYYVGGAVPFARDEAADFPRQEIPEGATVIYASLGSQAHLYARKASRLYRVLFETIRDCAGEGWHFVVSLSPPFSVEEFGGPFPNATVAAWVPQIDVLARASLAVIHGGLGTIKECISFGVPMICLPVDRDQPANAERVSLHRLGVGLDPEAVTSSALAGAIRNVLSNGETTRGLPEMQRIFREREQAMVGARVVEQSLRVRSAHP
jgi:MGT family glycosyltransferase